MTSLLDNALVRKFFGCGDLEHPNKTAGGRPITNHECEQAMALRVLTAMQQPIKRGERYLSYVTAGVWVESNDIQTVGEYHPAFLRLPDAHQKKECCEFSSGKWRNSTRDGAIVEICLSCLEKEKTKPAPEPKMGVFEYEKMQAKLQEIRNAGTVPEKCGCEYRDRVIYPAKCPVHGHPASAVEDAAKEIADIICHWFSNGPIGIPNPDILISALVKLARGLGHQDPK